MHFHIPVLHLYILSHREFVKCTLGEGRELQYNLLQVCFLHQLKDMIDESLEDNTDEMFFGIR